MGSIRRRGIVRSAPKTFHVFSAIPEVIAPYFMASIFGKAQARKIISVRVYDLRAGAVDKHKKIDDSPYGGGPGMVLKVDTIYRGVAALKRKIVRTMHRKTRIVLLSTRGKLFTSVEARRLVRYDHVVFICGRYEGVDERVARHIADEELSVGPFILSGGEIPAMLAIDAIARFVPGVLGKEESLEEVKGSYPVYTRPEVFYPDSKKAKKAWRVPQVLLSGDHKKIDEWRSARG
ncbi:MAG: tRNA (guanosine(37)-N1)-methyltransferase TrmD [Candidatus Paceibacterota bacterium]|jgi:tRNA (guanine37-N1)-methyltransferase